MMQKPTTTSDRKLKEQLIAMLEAGMTNRQINTFWVIQHYDHENIRYNRLFDLCLNEFWDIEEAFYTKRQMGDDLMELMDAGFVEFMEVKNPGGGEVMDYIVVSDSMRSR